MTAAETRLFRGVSFVVFALALVTPTWSVSAGSVSRALPAATWAPIIVAVGGKTGLEYFPLQSGGSRTPIEITGFKDVFASGSIAANGSKIVIPVTTGVLVADLATKTQRVLADPDGDPLDAAVGRDGTIYVANFTAGGSNVMVYPPKAAPYDASCGLKGPDTIAVDNEGDVFLNDSTLTAVVELPNGPNGLNPAACRQLKLRPRESGYSAGLAIDPKTDDLLVLDDPSFCAGGLEGRLVIHKKPYESGIGRVLQLGRNCSGTVRLDATSTHVFIGDEGVAGPPAFILQFTYPGGEPQGGYFGGNPGGFITVPNALPN